MSTRWWKRRSRRTTKNGKKSDGNDVTAPLEGKDSNARTVPMEDSDSDASSDTELKMVLDFFSFTHYCSRDCWSV
jgi:hypothetical protein